MRSQIAIVTGASRGIGEVVARELAKDGYTVALVARSKEKLVKISKEIGAKKGKTVCLPMDVTDKSQVRKGVDKLRRRKQKIALLVNAAGMIEPINSLVKVDGDDWQKTLEVNLLGSLWWIKQVLPLMIKNKDGAIVNFSGGGALAGRANFSAYAVSKAAVVRLTECLALEVKDKGIRVFAISPGGVNTVMLEQMLKAGKKTIGEAEWKALKQREKTGGEDPLVTARLIKWLIPKKAKVLTGKVISAVYDDWQRWDTKTINKMGKSDWLTMRRLDPYTLRRLGGIKI